MKKPSKAKVKTLDSVIVRNPLFCESCKERLPRHAKAELQGDTLLVQCPMTKPESRILCGHITAFKVNVN